MDMQGIFYAYGPAFKNNFNRKTFININLYPLMTHILKLKPSDSDGRFSEIKNVLK